MTSGSPRTWAVVLTHNAPDRLRRCLRAISSGILTPQVTLVIDNASRVAAEIDPGADGHPGVRFLRLPENLGPAGGYAAGLRAFADSEADLAWVMDDDCEPDPDCLSHLVERHLPSPTALLFPRESEPDGRVTNYPAWSGVLIPKEIVRAVGLPLESLFWWAEDSEYLKWRIPRAGFPVIRVAEAHLVHHRIRGSGPRPAWKYYYETRNNVYLRLYVQRGWRAYRRLAIGIPRTLVRILMKEDDRAVKLRLFVRGVYDGSRRRLGKTVPVA